MARIFFFILVCIASVMPADARPATSRIVAVEIESDVPLATYGDLAFRRVFGTIRGEVAADEPVAGLRAIAKGRAFVPYASRFEIILPIDAARADGIVVEAENRGAPGLLATLNSSPRAPVPSPPGAAAVAIGDGFVFAQHLSFARVQWQHGIAADVPETAQGVGQVILRDFGRLLAGRFATVSDRAGLPVFGHRLLVGVSQSAWMVNSLIAEGFNRDPTVGTAVYQGAFTRNGIGAVLAINRFADGDAQFPYLPLDRAPLTPAQLLTRPDSDPLLVDLASLTDFYRLRASVFTTAPGAGLLRRYATAAAHAPAGLAPDALIFGALKCNGGVAVPLNPISDAAVVRALLIGVATRIGARVATPHRLPREAMFAVQPAPEGDGVNRLAGTALMVPRYKDGQPVGGVVLPDAVWPLGEAVPPALPPVGTTSITDVCGNFGGWRPLDAATLRARYGDRRAYLARVTDATDRLIVDGYVLPRDRQSMIDTIADRLPGDF